MVDERRVGPREGESASRSGPTRRYLLAAAGTTALLAGCTDTLSDDEHGASVADPETIDENASDDEDGEDTDESTETETQAETDDETETEAGTDNGTETENETDEETTTSNETETEEPTETEEETETEEQTETEKETEEPTEEETEKPTEEETEKPTEEETETETDEETETEEETEETETEETETEEETEEPTKEETETETDEEETETEEETEEEAGNPPLNEVIDHPSTRNSDHSPVIGPYPTETDAAIVMFDDPGCPACADFDAEVMPDLRDHTDNGELSIIWRGLGVISDWSEAALSIQWATYDRDADAFWNLREHVFENREAIDGDEDAIEESVSFLEENTDLDTDAIREDAESGAYEERIALDEDAAARSNVDATPYFHLFRDGEHRTEIRGYQEYQVFKNTLEL